MAKEYNFTISSRHLQHTRPPSDPVSTRAQQGGLAPWSAVGGGEDAGPNLLSHCSVPRESLWRLERPRQRFNSIQVHSTLVQKCLDGTTKHIGNLLYNKHGHKVLEFFMNAIL